MKLRDFAFLLLGILLCFLGSLFRSEPEAPSLHSPVSVRPPVPGSGEASTTELRDRDAVIEALRREVAEQDVRRKALEARLSAVPARALEEASRRASVAGTWESNCGPVTLEHPPAQGGKPVAITGGSWVQEGKYHGRITGGTFDPSTGEVRFTWYQDWDGQEGETTLQMSADGRRLIGAYVSKQGGRGHWDFVRDGANVNSWEIEDLKKRLEDGIEPIRKE